MKFLVTGGCGFIGRHLVQSLQNFGSVVVIDNLSPKVHGENPNLCLRVGEFHKFDIRDTQRLKEVLEIGFDYIIHLAAETGTGESMYEIGAYVSGNDFGLASLLDAIVRSDSRPKGIVFTSSRAVYGEGGYRDSYGTLIFPDSRQRQDLDHMRWDYLSADGHKLTPVAASEDFPLNPSSVYAATKISNEFLLKVFSSSYDVPVVVLRPQNVYGPGQSLSNPYTGVTSLFINQALQGKPIELYEDGNIGRDFVYIGDVVCCITSCFGYIEKNGGYSIFNVGSGTLVTLGELVLTLSRLFGREVQYFVGGRYRLGDVRNAVCSMDYSTKAFGMLQTTTLMDGLGQTLRWIESNAVELPNIDIALGELKKYGLTNS